MNAPTRSLGTRHVSSWLQGSPARLNRGAQGSPPGPLRPDPHASPLGAHPCGRSRQAETSASTNAPVMTTGNVEVSLGVFPLDRPLYPRRGGSGFPPLGGQTDRFFPTHAPRRLPFGPFEGKGPGPAADGGTQPTGERVHAAHHRNGSTDA